MGLANGTSRRAESGDSEAAWLASLQRMADDRNQQPHHSRCASGSSTRRVDDTVSLDPSHDQKVRGLQRPYPPGSDRLLRTSRLRSHDHRSGADRLPRRTGSAVDDGGSSGPPPAGGLPDRATRAPRESPPAWPDRPPAATVGADSRRAGPAYSSRLSTRPAASRSAHCSPDW